MLPAHAFFAHAYAGNVNKHRSCMPALQAWAENHHNNLKVPKLSVESSLASRAPLHAATPRLLLSTIYSSCITIMLSVQLRPWQACAEKLLFAVSYTGPLIGGKVR